MSAKLFHCFCKHACACNLLAQVFVCSVPYLSAMAKGLAVAVNAKALAKAQAQAKAKAKAAAKKKAAAAKMRKAAAVEPHMEDLEANELDEHDEPMEGSGQVQVQKVVRDEAKQTSKILGWLKYRADPLKNKSGKQLDEAQQSLQDNLFVLLLWFCFMMSCTCHVVYSAGLLLPGQ